MEEVEYNYFANNTKALKRTRQIVVLSQTKRTFSDLDKSERDMLTF